MLRAADYRADDSVFQDIFNILDFERRDSINLEEFLPIVEVLEEHKHWFVKPKRIPKIFTL